MGHDTAARSGIVATWAAVVWAEALLLLGIVLLGIVAAQPSCSFISLGCSGEPSDDGTLVVLTLGVGLVALVASPIVAARLSGWPSAVVAALFAFGAFIAALIVGAVLIGAFANDGRSGCRARPRRRGHHRRTTAVPAGNTDARGVGCVARSPGRCVRGDGSTSQPVDLRLQAPCSARDRLRRHGHPAA